MKKIIWRLRFSLRMLIKSRWITGIWYFWHEESAYACEEGFWDLDDNPELAADEAMTYWNY